MFGVLTTTRRGPSGRGLQHRAIVTWLNKIVGLMKLGCEGIREEGGAFQFGKRINGVQKGVNQ